MKFTHLRENSAIFPAKNKKPLFRATLNERKNGMKKETDNHEALAVLNSIPQNGSALVFSLLR